jgi:hypothetical protein
VFVIIDCDKCAIRGVGCSDCVISVLLDAPPKIEFAEPELRAIGALADAGLVPHLRLIPLDTADKSPDTAFGVEPSAERSTPYVQRARRQVS